MCEGLAVMASPSGVCCWLGVSAGAPGVGPHVVQVLAGVRRLLDGIRARVATQCGAAPADVWLAVRVWPTVRGERLVGAIPVAVASSSHAAAVGARRERYGFP